MFRDQKAAVDIGAADTQIDFTPKSEKPAAMNPGRRPTLTMLAGCNSSSISGTTALGERVDCSSKKSKKSDEWMRDAALFESEVRPYRFLSLCRDLIAQATV
jgi:hypothetical protein